MGRSKGTSQKTDTKTTLAETFVASHEYTSLDNVIKELTKCEAFLWYSTSWMSQYQTGKPEMNVFEFPDRSKVMIEDGVVSIYM